jgi:hypothetical protein
MIRNLHAGLCGIGQSGGRRQMRGGVDRVRHPGRTESRDVGRGYGPRARD